MVTTSLCPDAVLTALLAQPGEEDFAARIAALLIDYPTDPRLHFLTGSLAAGTQDYAAAIVSLQRAVDIDPAYSLARFQLGLLKLTMGEAADAETIWSPLHLLAVDDPLYCFVAGLRNMIHDQFDEAVRLLERGIDFNIANPGLNDEMTRVIAAIRARPVDNSSDDASSATHLLLQQSALRTTHH